MSKIKINLASGASLEKPLITCFKGTSADYIVLDNETNGSMGLPIICISKLNGNSVEKILDQTEWASLKENLRSIVKGNNLPYLPVPEVLTAQDDFFTQLTLPLASFDLLKNVYKPVAPAIEPTPVSNDSIAPVQDASVDPIVAPVVESSTPVAPANEVNIPPVVAPEVPAAMDLGQIASPVVPNDTPAVPDINISPVQETITPAPVVESASVVAPVIETPTVEPVIDSPIIPGGEVAPIVDMPVNPVTEIAPVQDVVTPVEPVIPETSAVDNGNLDINEIKENFMKSCETMFDALIKKFENK